MLPGNRDGQTNLWERRGLVAGLVVLAVVSAIYLGCIVSPPSLMDDVDAVQAQIARNMLHSGDWVTARLDGIPYLEKAPLIYWLIAIFLRAFRRGRLGGAAFPWRFPPSGWRG